MWSVDPGEELVYGAIGDIGDGVFLPESHAVQLRAIIGSRTWGELRAIIGAEAASDIHERTEPEDEAEPADEDPYDPEVIPGWGDGDWPDWPQQRMLDWMPADLLDAYADIAETRLNGEYVGIPAHRLDELAQELEARGHPCRRDDALVSLVSRF